MKGGRKIKVYVVTVDIDFEGKDIDAVFNTNPKAEKYVADYKKKYPNCEEEIDIQEWEVK